MGTNPTLQKLIRKKAIHKPNRKIAQTQNNIQQFRKKEKNKKQHTIIQKRKIKKLQNIVHNRQK